MDLRQIEYFVALYDERSITKAARRLNVVQPAVSMQISRIERSFKTKLFHRTSRGVLPTDTGRTFYGLCQKILNEVYEAQRYLRDASGNVAGHLTIGVMPSVANSVLPAVLVGYKSSYPDVTLRIVEAYSGSLLDQLHAGNLDLAIVNNSGPLSDTAIFPLFRDYLIFATRYQAGKRFAHTIESHRLSEFRLVLPSQRQGMRGLIDSILAAKGIALQPEIELDSLGPTIELVAKSDWGTILPIIAVKQALDRKLLRAQRIIDPAIPREVIAVSPLTRTPTLAAELFLKSLKAMSLLCLSELPDPFLQADQFRS
ncbi:MULTISPECIES: LysR family transcriptional regulator [Bradyrhizobium]|uniref:Transcriptional regulator, LysR family n=2 Tax=Bradyrhizobium TaxID=374 RepID=A0ABY0PE65_9BRAD|nr:MULTISPECIES: LysR family transcriptional regulator [Bradyrhizobium]SDI19796.1 transcriptional regulator, LysR family [Bradyrhizobium ottawaense]SED74735.1 transcriptional regulator, LysR family [Bradyrhizobium lablabi]SHL70315.1 transcriptional regulator, LysR family [Bradyrhizobium lablabi]